MCWFKTSFRFGLRFILGWFRVEPGLSQWFIADWPKVGAKFYLKLVQDLIRNVENAFVVFWVWIWACFGLG